MTLRAVDILRKKRDGHTLTPEEIEAFVTGATTGSWPAYQVSALLMAIVLRGLDAAETATLTQAMVRSGITLDLSDLPGPKVDKHSTGGVGDKTSIVVVPLVAACGCCVPKMSGRGLGHTGGTLDKLESIPGFRTQLSLDEFREALRKIGCALVSQSKEIAPADKVLYALRDVTATVDSIGLIASSVMSKKLAEGIGSLVLDVKCGRGAFMKTRQDASALAERLVAIGSANGVRTEAFITAMDAPLGNTVGNSLEVIESVETLKGRGPEDLTTLALELAARMVRLAGAAATDREAETKVKDALRSGRALEKFREIILQQGGDARVVDDYHQFPQAPDRYVFKAPRSGYIVAMHAELIGQATMLVGAGREKVEDKIDLSAGALLLVKPGHEVRSGEPILDLHYRNRQHLQTAIDLLRQAIHIDDSPPPQGTLIYGTVRPAG